MSSANRLEQPPFPRQHQNNIFQNKTPKVDVYAISANCGAHFPQWQAMRIYVESEGDGKRKYAAKGNDKSAAVNIVEKKALRGRI